MESETKVRWKEYIEAYGPVIVVWVYIGSLLALPKYSIWNAVLQAICILFWSYGGHVLAHKVSETGPFHKLNPHVFLHHNKSIDLPRWLELIIEAIVNFFGFFILYIVQIFFQFELFSPSLLLGAAFLYITIHILDYSVRGNTNHRLHHTKTFCNYDPEFFDALFGTLCEPEKPYTNMIWEIPHALLAFSLAGLCKYLLNLD
jgi:hypothetical protein